MIKHDQTDKIRDCAWFAVFILFVWLDSLRPCQQSFSYVGTGLPGLNQYYARINASYSMTRRSDAGEARNCGTLVSSSQCLNTKCGQSKLFGTGPGQRPGWAGYGSRLFGQTQIWVYRFCRIFKRKYGHIHGIQKSLAIQMPNSENGTFIILSFFKKKRGFIPGGAEKGGGYSGAHPYYVIHKELPPLPPPPPRMS